MCLNRCLQTNRNHRNAEGTLLAIMLRGNVRDRRPVEPHNHGQEEQRDMSWVNRELCTGCGGCVEVCHVPGAISVEGDHASVDRALCDECDACVEACPTGAMEGGPGQGRVAPGLVSASEDDPIRVKGTSSGEAANKIETTQGLPPTTLAPLSDTRIGQDSSEQRGRQRAGRRERHRRRRRLRQRRGGGKGQGSGS